MRTVKKSVCLLISVMMIISSFSFTGIAADYSEHWAKGAIDTLLSSGVISGDSNGSIRPDDKILRSEFVKVVNRYFGFVNSDGSNFSDVKADKWYYNEFAIAKTQGYITGDNLGNANPEAYITRAEVSVILSRILKLGLNYNVNFADKDSIPEWAIGYIGAMVENGLISGYEDGTVKATNNITRAEAFSLISRTSKPSADNQEKEPEPEKTGNTNSMISIGGSSSTPPSSSGGGGGGGSSSGSTSSSASVELRSFDRNNYAFELDAKNVASFDVQIVVGNNEYVKTISLPATESKVQGVYKINILDEILDVIKSRIDDVTAENALGENYKINVKAKGKSGSSDSKYKTLVTIPVSFEILADPEISYEQYKETGKVIVTWDVDAKATSYDVKLFDENNIDITNDSSVLISNGKVEITTGVDNVFVNKYKITVASRGAGLVLDSDTVTVDIDPDVLSGKGTEEKPFVIKYPEQLKLMANNPSAYHIIIKDMTVTAEDMVADVFNGTLEGRLDNNTGVKPLITLEIEDESSNVGLFKELGEGALVKNLMFDGFVYGNGNVGAVAGKATKATIENCETEAEISSTGMNAGGIAGILEDCTVKYSKNHGVVYSESNNVGGIAGTASGEIIECYNAGMIIADGSNAGGIAGNSEGEKVVINNCYNLGYIESSDKSAGIIANANAEKEINIAYNYNIAVSTESTAPIFAEIGASRKRIIENNYISDVVAASTEEEGLIVSGDKNTKLPEVIAVNNMSNLTSYKNFSGDVWKIVATEEFMFPQLVNNKNTATVNTLAPVKGLTVSGNTVSFNAVENAEYYNVFVYSAIGELVETVSVETTSVEISNFIFTENYDVVVVAVANGYVSSNYVTKTYANKGIKRPDKVKNLVASYSFKDTTEEKSDDYDEENLILTWDANSEAEAYKVVIKNESGKKIYEDVTTANEYVYEFGQDIPYGEKEIQYEVYSKVGEYLSVAAPGSMDILFGGGKGTATDPYKIYTHRQYMNIYTFIDTYTSSNFLQCADIYTPVTEIIKSFSGTYKGEVTDTATHRVLSLSINKTAADKVALAGMFGYLAGSVENMRIKGSVKAALVADGMVESLSGIGSIAGASKNKTTKITNCINEAEIIHVSGAPSSYNGVGGIIGAPYNGSIVITDCINAAKITAGIGVVGGIAGYCTASVTNCANYGDITSSGGSVGGIAGNGYGAMTNVYNSGSISSKTSSGGAGGISGMLSSSTINNAYNEGEVITAEKYSGGIVGKVWPSAGANAFIKNTVNMSDGIKATASGEKTAGGIAGAFVRGNIVSISNSISYGMNNAIDTKFGTPNAAGTTYLKYVDPAKLEDYIYNDDTTYFYNKSGAAIEETQGIGLKDVELKNLLAKDATFSSEYWEYDAETGFPMLKIASICKGYIDLYELNVNNAINETPTITTGVNASYVYEDLNIDNKDDSDREKISLEWKENKKAEGYRVVIKKGDNVLKEETVLTTEYLYDFTDDITNEDSVISYAVYVSVKGTETELGSGDLDFSFGGGEGTAIDPYKIYNHKQYMNFYKGIETYKSMHFVQCADIYTPIKVIIPQFSGSYKGEVTESASHRVVVLDINSEGNPYVGMFGYLTGTVENIRTKGSVRGIIAGTVTKDASGMGAIAGGSREKTTKIINCINEAEINHTQGGPGSYYGVGGIIGSSYNSDIVIKDCINAGKVTSVITNVGGITGYTSVRIENCANFGDITGNGSTGGIAGYAYSTGVTKAYNAGNIKTTTSSGGAGGIVGNVTAITISEAYNDNVVITGQKYSGGIGGSFYPSDAAVSYINNSVNMATDITATSNKTAGGIGGGARRGKAFVISNTITYGMENTIPANFKDTAAWKGGDGVTYLKYVDITNVADYINNPDTSYVYNKSGATIDPALGVSITKDKLTTLLTDDSSFSPDIWCYDVNGLPTLKVAANFKALKDKYNLSVNEIPEINEDEGGEEGGEEGGDVDDGPVIVTGVSAEYIYEDVNTNNTDADDKEKISLSWSATEGAAAYKVVINKGATVLKQEEVTALSYTYDFTKNITADDTAISYEVSVKIGEEYTEIGKGDLDITFGGGDGSIDNPYKVYNHRQYMNFYNGIDGLRTKNFLQCADIYEPITVIIDNFSGSYIGEKTETVTHRVVNLAINADLEAAKSFIGMFGYLQGTVENIRTKGFVKGYIVGDGAISKAVGIAGIAGGSRAKTTRIVNCINEAMITHVSGQPNDTYNGTAGIIGSAYQSDIIVSDCINAGKITAAMSRVGGIVGISQANVTNCINYGTVVGSSSVAGVVGDAYNGTVIKCANMGAIDGTASTSAVGGVVGLVGVATISECYNEGTITGSSAIGGISGRVYPGGGKNSGISNALNKGTVKTDNTYNMLTAGSLSGSYARGNSFALTNVINLSDSPLCVVPTGFKATGSAWKDTTSDGSVILTSAYYMAEESTLPETQGVMKNEAAMKTLLADDNTFSTDIWGYDSVTGLPSLKFVASLISKANGLNLEIDKEPGASDDEGGEDDGGEGEGGESGEGGSQGGGQVTPPAEEPPVIVMGVNAEYEFEDINTDKTDADDKELIKLTWSETNKADAYKVTVKKGETILKEEEVTTLNYVYNFANDVAAGDATISYAVSVKIKDAYTEIGKGDLDITFGGGTGVAADPYKIYSHRHYMNFANNQTALLAKAFLQCADIYTPVTVVIDEFKGSYVGEVKEGITHRIINLAIETTAEDAKPCVGMFGYMTGGVIENIRTQGFVKGVLAGTNAKSHCGMGGIVGSSTSKSAKIINCINEADITHTSGQPHSYNGIGGIIGDSYVSGFTITNCINSGDISSKMTRTGGVTGYTQAIITGCVNYGSVVGQGSTGGISGDSYNGSVTNCVNMGVVNGSSVVGGITGMVGSIVISGCYNGGTVKGDSSLGGIAGRAYPSNGSTAEINNSVNNGTITLKKSDASTTGAIAGHYRRGKEFKITNVINYSDSIVCVIPAGFTSSWTDSTADSPTITFASAYYMAEASELPESQGVMKSEAEMKTLLETDNTFSSDVWTYDEAGLPTLKNIPDFEKIKTDYSL